MNFHQQFAETAQERDTDRLIVDESARSAVAADHPADQKHVTFTRQIVVVHQFERRVTSMQLETRRDRCLVSAMTDRPLIGPAAKSQAQRIENYGFSSTGLTRERAQSGGKSEVQTIDQHHVADG